MSEHRTYTRYVLLQLLPAPGWQWVYYDDTHGHIVSPLACLALAEPREYPTATDGTTMPRHIPVPSWLPAEETRLVVGLDYETDTDTFHVCQEARNFCGLLKPGQTLDDLDSAETIRCARHMPTGPVLPYEPETGHKAAGAQP